MDDIREGVGYVIRNKKTKMDYIVEDLLGRGGFAKVFKIRNTTTDETLAAKVISKKRFAELRKDSCDEISIHKSLDHQNIVRFHSHFYLKGLLYMLIEICPCGHLDDLYKRRRIFHRLEVQYFMKQIISACAYLHSKNVIHRDLSLNNILIFDGMLLKICDFGLSVRVKRNIKRKLCGTYLYIPPEAFRKGLYSFKSDIWSLGCIMYILLIGFEPFSQHLASNVKKFDYYLPKNLPFEEYNLISVLLRFDPALRPSADEILTFKYFADSSCANVQALNSMSRLKTGPRPQDLLLDPNELSLVENICRDKCCRGKWSGLAGALRLLDPVLKRGVAGVNSEMPSVSAEPFICVSKWIIGSSRYGLAYQLTDSSSGCLFNDHTHLTRLRLSNGTIYVYTDGESEVLFEFNNCPPRLLKKAKVLNVNQKFMAEELQGCPAPGVSTNSVSTKVYVRAWGKTDRGIHFFLSNGTFQSNYNDGIKCVISPETRAVCIMDRAGNLTVSTFQLIVRYGSSPQIASCLSYSKLVLERLVEGFIACDLVKNLEHY